MKLSKLNVGESAKIVKICSDRDFKAMLMNMGVTTGEYIKLERKAPFSNLRQYTVRNIGIAIREDKTDQIEVITEE